MRHQFRVTVDARRDVHTGPNIWRDWVERVLNAAIQLENGQDDGDQINIEVGYLENALWQASGYKMACPTESHPISACDSVSTPATLDEVRKAIADYGMDPALVEQIDEGLFNIPLPVTIEDLLTSKLKVGHTAFEINGIQFVVEMP